jgi:predicted dehydrogenase
MMHRTGRMTRRRFLQGAAAAAAPVVIPASALGQEGRPAPSGRIVMGGIGVGGQGRGDLGAFRGMGDVQIIAVCDPSQKNAEQAKAECEGGGKNSCAILKDFRELCARKDIDAVLIATPDHWHALAVCEAAKGGKDIYCEKPMSLTVREARTMVKVVRKYERVFQTGSQQRSSEEFIKACELVCNGRIGKVISIHVNVGGPSGDRTFPGQPVPPGFDFDLWLGQAPQREYHPDVVSPGGWRGIRDFSGGGMTDWGAHHFDIAQWAMGMDESGPVEVNPPQGKDYKTLTYKYANGTLLYHGEAMAPEGKVNGVLFIGDKGRIEVNRGYFKATPEEIEKAAAGPNDIKLFRSPGHHRNFIDCVKKREKPVCDVEIGCRSVTVCHLGNIAYWTRKPFGWDPKKEMILGNDKAAEWLDRPKRAPWKLAT